MQLLESVNVVQFEIFAVAAALSAILFATGFVLGRLTKNHSVRVPMEVIHALATARFAAAPLANHKPQTKGGDDAKILHDIEALLHHVEHEKDFGKAKAFALHELDRIIHDHGSNAELKDLHHKVEVAHNKHDIEVALHAYIDHHKH